MLSQTLEYALRTVVCLAGDDPEAQQTTAEIARITKVPPAYLSKVIQALNRAGIVKSQRGVKGGVTLVRSPEELTILDIVNAVDPIKRIKTCPLELEAHGRNLCPLHRRLDNALEQTEEAFRQTTLAEILAEPTTSVPLREHPQKKPRGARKKK